MFCNREHKRGSFDPRENKRGSFDPQGLVFFDPATMNSQGQGEHIEAKLKAVMAINAEILARLEGSLENDSDVVLKRHYQLVWNQAECICSLKEDIKTIKGIVQDFKFFPLSLFFFFSHLHPFVPLPSA